MRKKFRDRSKEPIIKYQFLSPDLIIYIIKVPKMLKLYLFNYPNIDGSYAFSFSFQSTELVLPELKAMLRPSWRKHSDCNSLEAKRTRKQYFNVQSTENAI